MKNKKKINVGGVALFDGILFTSEYRQVSIERKNGKLKSRVINLVKNKNIIAKIPILRGIIGLKNQIGNASFDFIKSSGEDGKNSKIQTFISYAVLISICIILPLLISLPFKQNLRQIIQAVAIFLEFILYLSMFKITSEFDEVFKYHGAEHKAVNAYENLDIKDITLENVKKQSRFHKRCGGNFVVYFILLSILTVFIPIDNIILKAVVMLLLSVLNIGIAYEIVNIFSKFRKPFDVINYPATLIQLVTTKEPTDEMLKLAIYGVLGAVREKNGIPIQEYITKYINENLKQKEYDTQDIYAILEYVTKIDRNKLILQKDTFILSLSQEIKCDELLNKYYYDKYPLQYITHTQFFYNEVYYVDENVLIPRSDSEILVEKAIEYIGKENITKVIDLCTGSGALGISIAKNSNVESMTLIDISLGAIKVAKTNITKNKVEYKVTTQISDLLQERIKIIAEEEERINNLNDNENIEDSNIEKLNENMVDMIVSNPPYIKTEVIASLQEEVKKEPHLALDGGKDGLDFYLRIIKEAETVLKLNGILILEIGYDQLEDIKKIIKENGKYEFIESVKDYGGNDRVVVCRLVTKE